MTSVEHPIGRLHLLTRSYTPYKEGSIGQSNKTVTFGKTVFVCHVNSSRPLVKSPVSNRTELWPIFSGWIMEYIEDITRGFISYQIFETSSVI